MHKLLNGKKIEMTAAEIAEHEEAQAVGQAAIEARQLEKKEKLKEKVLALQVGGLPQTIIELVLPESKEYFKEQKA